MHLALARHLPSPIYPSRRDCRQKLQVGWQMRHVPSKNANWVESQSRMLAGINQFGQCHSCAANKPIHWHSANKQAKNELIIVNIAPEHVDRYQIPHTDPITSQLQISSLLSVFLDNNCSLLALRCNKKKKTLNNFNKIINANGLQILPHPFAALSTSCCCFYSCYFCYRFPNLQTAARAGSAVSFHFVL